MEFRIHHSKDFDGTDFFEIGPAQYSGKHWVAGYMFIQEFDFSVAEQALNNHLPNYDHYAMNNVDENSGREIVTEWKSLATELTFEGKPAWAILGLESEFEEYKTYLEENRTKISQMLAQLASECETFCTEASGFCILGL